MALARPSGDSEALDLEVVIAAGRRGGRAAGRAGGTLAGWTRPSATPCAGVAPGGARGRGRGRRAVAAGRPALAGLLEAVPLRVGGAADAGDPQREVVRVVACLSDSS